MPHKEMILSHLKAHGSITALEAINEYGILRLGARIYDLKSAGWPIKTDMETSKNRFGVPVRYARYSLEGNHGDQQMPGVQGGEIASKAISV